MSNEYSCIDCAMSGCEFPDRGRPKFCPTDDFELEREQWLLERLDEKENRKVIEAASVSVHTASDLKLSHMEEIIFFARELGAKKIGIASCISLSAEARAAAKVLRAHGFEVAGAICKIGSITYGDLGIHVARRSDETVVCNPIYQAKVLNDAKTDLNIVMGLCTGHDALFLKYSDALCTLLTAKDFKFDHYSVRALRPDDESGELEQLLRGEERNQ